MFIEYYFNSKTGELKHVGSRKEANALPNEWVRIQEVTYNSIKLAIKFALEKAGEK